MLSTTRQPFNWSLLFRVVLGAVVVYLLIEIVSHLSVVFIMLAVAGMVAFILDPLINRMSKHMPRFVGIIITYVVLIAVLAVTAGLVIPQIVEQVSHFQHRLPEYQAQIQEKAGQARDWYDTLPDSVKEQLGNVQRSLQETGRAVLQTTLQAFLGIVGWAAKGVIILVLSIYLLMDKDLIRDSVLGLVPRSARAETITVGAEVLNVIRAYLRGQIVVIAFVAIFVTAGLLVARIPYALTIGTIVGILEVIPYFGAAAGAIPAVTLGYIHHGPTTTLGLIVFFIVINQLEGHVVIPQVMGRSLEMRPIVVLLSLLVGAEVAGIPGLIVAVPVCRIVQVLLEHGLRLYQASRSATAEEKLRTGELESPGFAPPVALEVAPLPSGRGQLLQFQAPSSVERTTVVERTIEKTEPAVDMTREEKAPDSSLLSPPTRRMTPPKTETPDGKDDGPHEGPPPRRGRKHE